MADYFGVLVVITLIWAAITLSNLLKAFKGFREDYRRVHGLDQSSVEPQ